jgi:hypothetical protein
MSLITLAQTLYARHRQLLAREPSDRGDVPGWVMVTVMTAALVAALLAIAAPQLTSAFTSAIARIVG